MVQFSKPDNKTAVSIANKYTVAQYQTRGTIVGLLKFSQNLKRKREAELANKPAMCFIGTFFSGSFLP